MLYIFTAIALKIGFDYFDQPGICLDADSLGRLKFFESAKMKKIE